MKAATFDYVRPNDIDEAVAALGEAGSSAKLLAGGQSLGPMLNLRLVRPALLVDIGRIEALRRIEDAGEAWRIGAGVTHARLEDAHGSLPGAEMLTTVAGGIAHRSVRNKGTIGGSLAHADPAGDWPLALAALGASIVVRGPRGVSRTLPADGFIAATFTTALREDELIEAILVPKLPPAARWGYFKFCRKVGEFPDASAAAVFDPERRVARIFLGALEGPPRSLPRLAEEVARHGAATATPSIVADAIGGPDAATRRMRASAVLRALRQALGA
jgi:carbon-monoxide dehydrogenase medium subunit